MSKVITFSTKYPPYHPKKGNPTYFAEGILKSINELDLISDPDALHECVNNYYHLNDELNPYDLTKVKYTTIRAGHRFKAGDKFSPRVWGNDINPKSERRGPYHSKQIIIAPDITIVKTWDILIEELNEKENGIGLLFTIGGNEQNMPIHIAKNDGLEKQDFIDWFTLSPTFKKKKLFDGQIICWNKNINY